MKLNPDQLLILDKDGTIYGKAEGLPKECWPGLSEFLIRQSAKRNVAVYSHADLESIKQHLGENVQHLDGVFSQQEPIMSNRDVLLFEGGLHLRSEVAEITEATKARVEAAREAVVEKDNAELVETLRIMLFIFEFNYFYERERRRGTLMDDNAKARYIEHHMRIYKGISSDLDFHFPSPFHSGATLTPELKQTILRQNELIEEKGAAEYHKAIRLMQRELKVRRTRAGFRTVLDTYHDRIGQEWTYQSSGLPVSREDYYQNPYYNKGYGSRPGLDKKDLHRLRLRMQSEGHDEPMEMIMIEDWDGVRGGLCHSVHESDPRTPVLVVDPEDSGWIQRGAIEGLVERLFQNPKGPDHGFRAMLSDAPTTSTGFFRRSCNLTLESHPFVLGEGQRAGLVGFEATPRNLEFLENLNRNAR